jgi:hypothetical protein
MFIPYLWSTSACVRQFCYAGIFFFKKILYSDMGRLSWALGLLMALYGASVRPCDFFLLRTHYGSC